jgi:hypothetical protein
MRAYLDAQAAAKRPSAPELDEAAEPAEPKVIEALVEEQTGAGMGQGDGDGDAETDEGGVGADGAQGKLPPELQPLPVTAFGRYVKVLFCSNEFLFLR